jgi:hypothetical protein
MHGNITPTRRLVASPHRSLRVRAWRNALIIAINSGLDQQLFGLEPDGGPAEPVLYGFDFFSETTIAPGLAWVADIGWSELKVHAAIWPAADAARLIACFNAGFHAGECFATGWLERLSGRWLQDSWPFLSCRRNRLALVANATIEPHGFSDHGKFFCERA